MYILAHIVRVWRATTSKRNPQACPDENQNHPSIPFPLCPDFDWKRTCVCGSPLYLLMLHISLFGQATGQKCRNYCGHSSSVIKCSIKHYQCLQNCTNFIQKQGGCAVKYYWNYAKHNNVSSSIFTKNFIQGWFLLFIIVHRKEQPISIQYSENLMPEITATSSVLLTFLYHSLCLLLTISRPSNLCFINA